MLFLGKDDIKAFFVLESKKNFASFANIRRRRSDHQLVLFVPILMFPPETDSTAGGFFCWLTVLFILSGSADEATCRFVSAPSPIGSGPVSKLSKVSQVPSICKIFFCIVLHF